MRTYNTATCTSRYIYYDWIMHGYRYDHVEPHTQALVAGYLSCCHNLCNDAEIVTREDYLFIKCQIILTDATIIFTLKYGVLATI